MKEIRAALVDTEMIHTISIFTGILELFGGYYSGLNIKSSMPIAPNLFFGE